MKLFNFIFEPLRELKKTIKEINDSEKEISSLSDEDIRNESRKLQGRAREGSLNGARSGLPAVALAKAGEELNNLLPRAFALVREAAKRTLNQRHFDAQLIGGIVLHQGKIAEMATGEGKTLAATAPAYLNALGGKGVHIVTVNEYLAKRDTVWMGQIYYFLGLKVACLVHEGALLYDPHYKIPQGQETAIDRERDKRGSYLVQTDYLKPISRREAYEADITYGTNHEFGFDYLRDNLAHRSEEQVQFRVNPFTGQRESALNYVIIDEVDSILIDEARTPLIISAPDTESSDYYRIFSRIASMLKPDEDYTVDEKYRAAHITESGIDKVEKSLKIKNIYAPENIRLTHYLEESLKARALFKRDKDYVVSSGEGPASGGKNNEIIIVDQNTGRLMLGRRYSGGLHQAIEAKEGVAVQQESRTYAQITIQNYFRLYKKLAGMTGTAQTSAEEFDKVYGLAAVTVPTNKPMNRQNLPDVIYKNEEAKYGAVVEEVKKRQKTGQPVLLGAISIEKNEALSRHFQQAGIGHEILNAKNHEREGAIIAQAGKSGAVTLATNMAGRGVDIILGGTPPDLIEAEKIKNLGGLHVIGTERHEARRIDNQLRGRAGRQGDPGSSQFFLSLEDDLLRIFGGERIKNLMETFNMPEDLPIESSLISKTVSQAQSRIEGFNFDARKHLLEYDDVLNKQRLTIYEKRQEILESKMLKVKSDTEEKIISLSPAALSMSLSILDLLWMNYLEDMETLRDSVRLRAYGQHDPLAEYRRESRLLFQQILQDFEKWVEENSEKLKETNDMERKENIKDGVGQVIKQPLSTSHSAFNTQKVGLPAEAPRSGAKVGRNDPCPCGSGKKYKKCHGI